MSTELPYGPMYGPLYFATVMGTAFYGVTCMQTFLYYAHYQNDHLRTKILVAVLWALDTIHEALVVSAVYKYFMAGWINPYSIDVTNPEFVFLLTGIVGIITQGFFVYRLYIFSGKKILGPLVWVTSAIIELVTVLIFIKRQLYSSNGVQVVSDVNNDSTTTIVATLCLAFAAAVDILIAICLTYLLVRKRSAATFPSTANSLQRLTVFAVNTGIWTAIFALLTIILVNVFLTNLFYAVFGVPLCSVYCNTLLANLNARSYVRGEAATQQFDVDLFKNSSVPASDNFMGDKHHGVVRVARSANQAVWKATEVARFPDTNRSATPESV